MRARRRLAIAALWGELKIICGLPRRRPSAGGCAGCSQCRHLTESECPTPIIGGFFARLYWRWDVPGLEAGGRSRSDLAEERPAKKESLWTGVHKRSVSRYPGISRGVLTQAGGHTNPALGLRG